MFTRDAPCIINYPKHKFVACTRKVSYSNLIGYALSYLLIWACNPGLKELSEWITGNIFFLKLEYGKSCLQLNKHKFVKNEIEPPDISLM